MCFTALHRDEADLEKNKTSGFYEGTEIAVDQLVEHVIAMSANAPEFSCGVQRS